MSSAGLPSSRPTGAQDAKDKISPFVEHFARFGYAAKGAVYAIVGSLAALAAYGSGGQTTGSKGALRSLMDEPFGMALLGIIALGLACYATWYLIRAIEDPEYEGKDADGIRKRIIFFLKGLAHFGLVLAVIQMFRGTGAGAGGDDDGVSDWTATLLSLTLGRWIVAAVGVGVIAFGLKQVYDAWRSDLDDRLRYGEMDPKVRRWVIRVSRFGIAARGLIFTLIGGFLVTAAYHQNPGEARGVGGALRSLQGQPYGRWLLGVVALGLIAYGLYEIVRARYRQIRPLR